MDVGAVVIEPGTGSGIDLSSCISQTVPPESVIKTAAAAASWGNEKLHRRIGRGRLDVAPIR